MSTRKYRIINGICYPHLFTNKDQPTHANSNMTDPTSYYYDPAVRLNESDMLKFVGKPICVEHDVKACIGEISSVWKDRDNQMRMTGRIYTDTQEGENYFNAINSGQLGSLSVGYGISVDPQSGEVMNKQFDEISVCEQPFFPGAEIRVAASDKFNYLNLKTNLDKKKVLNFKIMADLASSSSIEAGNKDAAELARVHDDMLKKNEEMAKELAAMKEARLADQQFINQAKAEQARQKQQYINEMKPQLEEALKTQALIQKETFGENADVPEDWKLVAEDAFTNPEMAQIARTITASTKAFLKNREATLNLQNQLREKDEEMKRLNQNQTIAMTHVEASKRLHLATGQDLSPNPSASTQAPAITQQITASKISHLFTRKAPSDAEAQLYRNNFGREPPSGQDLVQINASAVASGENMYEEPPTHILKASVRNSAANSESGRPLFNMLRKHSYKGMNPNAFSATTETVLEK
jgi:hypothetical protein